MSKLLIVDDDYMVREGILRFVDWKAYKITEIFEASNGKDALDIVKHSSLDTLITDISMPKMNGIELVEIVREFLPDCRVVFLSAYGTKINYKAAIRLSAVGFIEKPIDEAEFYEVLDKLFYVGGNRKEQLDAPEQEINNNFAKNNLISEIKTFINSNYHRKINISDLAEHFYVSYSHLCTLFKQNTGITIRNYLEGRRLESAKELLLKSDMRVYEIANAVGYIDIDYFTLLFKQKYGIVPSEFRRH